MNAKQATDSLAAIFATRRIVFWNDPAKDFLSLFDGEMFSPVEGVQVIRFDQMPALQVKLRVEREEANSRFLLYSPTPEPEDPLDDWLLDIRLYAHTFYADRGSLDLEALGLTTASLREHLNLRRLFLDSKDRFARLKNLVQPDDTADDLDRKMAAVAIKSDQAEDDAILRTLLHAFTEADDAIVLGEPPAVWGQATGRRPPSPAQPHAGSSTVSTRPLPGHARHRGGTTRSSDEGRQPAARK